MKMMNAMFLFLLATPLVFSEEESHFWETGIVNDRLNFGAWADMLYVDRSREDVPSFFNLSQIYIQANWNIHKRWRLFTELAYELLPDEQGSDDTEFEVERLFLEYKTSNALKFRLGKFNTQAGIVKPIHWTVTLDSLLSPIMEKNGYIPAKSIGLEILGEKVVPHGVLGYSLALSHSKSEIEDDQPINRAKGAGLDINYSRINRFRFGSSFYFYRDPKDKNRGVSGILPYLEWYFVPQKLLFRTEYLDLSREQADDLSSWYVKLKYQFHPQAYLNLRYDQGLDEALSLHFKRLSRTVTLAFWPTKKLRLKAEYGWNNLDNGTSFREWAMWVGYVFL